MPKASQPRRARSIGLRPDDEAQPDGAGHMQVPAPLPMQVPAVHARPGQHCWFRAPQAWQLRAVPASPTCEQRKPLLQVAVPPVVDGQQGWFAPPQALQILPASAVAPAWQTLPVWQMSPAQQAFPVAPQVEQMRVAVPPGFGQASPALQALPEQQALPSVPQTWQVLGPPPAVVWHDSPDVHSSTVPPLVLQQIAAEDPQGMQRSVVVSQRVPGAVQVAPPPPAQQRSSLPPQLAVAVLQAPAVQVPLLPPQVAFAATQVPRTQQPPL
jgi:hypothetical protein